MALRSKHFIISNIIIPLLVGLFIYLTSRNRTVLYDMFSYIGIRLQPINYPQFLRNYGCDFLWAYSLYWGVYFWGLFGGWQSLAIVAGIVVIPFALIMEFIQIPKSMPGTFDVFDIGIEVLAIGLAVIIANYRRQTYEKVNC